MVVGGGTRALPDDVRVNLTLLDGRCFGNGVVHVHYRHGSVTRRQKGSGDGKSKASTSRAPRAKDE